jgi:hypothetical protein
VRCRNPFGGEFARDAGEAPAGGMAVADSVDDIGWNPGGAAARRLGLRLRPRRSAMLGNQSLELVDGNEFRSPGHFDRLDQREDAAVERRAAHSERRSSLCARIDESLDTRRLSNDFGLRPGRAGGAMPSDLLVSASQAAARHSYSVH